ncbi:MAG: DUF106 domain-containing protein [Nitrososphaerota archaeon]|nr:DUF106 domain-containing protein [Nitrososphaerota archaeon]
MSAKKNKAAPAGSGSRTVTYVVVILFAVLIGYYVVLPAFLPRSAATATTTIGSSSYTVSLSPSTDIAGTQVTISGQGLPTRSNVTATFGAPSVALTNSTAQTPGCRTSASGLLEGCTFWVPSGSAPGSHTVTVTFSSGSASAVAAFTIPGYSPPLSTVLVTLTSVSLGLVTQLVTRKVVDLSKERRMRAEVNAFNKEKREATLANDKVKLDKLKKREIQVRQEQAKVSTARLKVTAITFVPLLAVYYLMATFLGGYGVIVAYSPVPIPILAAPTQNPSVFEVSLFWWYFLSSFAFSTMLSKLLHTQP